MPRSLTLSDAEHPAGDDAAKVRGPGVLKLLVLGHEATTGSLLDDPHEGVHEHVHADTGDEAVGDGVGEGHEGNAYEGGNGVAHVLPVDVRDSADHHGADQDKHAAGGPWRDRSEDGGEENGDEEAETSRHGSETGLATFTDTGTGLDEGSDGGSTEKSTDGDTDGVNHVTVNANVPG